MKLLCLALSMKLPAAQALLKLCPDDEPHDDVAAFEPAICLAIDDSAQPPACCCPALKSAPFCAAAARPAG
jgi:hypothetical protein